MLRLVRPVSSALFGAFDYSPLSVLPSYGKCFGSNPLPGQVVVAICFILAIRAYAHFHIWKRLDPVSLKDDVDALREWSTSLTKPLHGLQTAQLILSALLLFMAADSMETMATFRALLLLLQLTLAAVLAIGLEVGSPGNTHQALVGGTTVTHVSWALQILLLPGIWALGDEFLRSTSSGFIFGAFYYSLIFWCLGAFFILPNELKTSDTWAKGKENACEEDLQILESVEQAAEQQSIEDSKRSAPGVEQLCAQTRKEMSAAMFVGLVDFVLLIVLQFG